MLVISVPRSKDFFVCLFPFLSFSSFCSGSIIQLARQQRGGEAALRVDTDWTHLPSLGKWCMGGVRSGCVFIPGSFLLPRSDFASQIWGAAPAPGGEKRRRRRRIRFDFRDDVSYEFDARRKECRLLIKVYRDRPMLRWPRAEQARILELIPYGAVLSDLQREAELEVISRVWVIAKQK